MLKKLTANPLLSATIWIYLATGILSLGNYLYHVIMPRLLSPVLYGELEGAIAFLYIFSVPLSTMSIVIVKFVSDYKGKGDTEAIAGIYHFFKNKLFFYGTVTTVVMVLFSPFITSFLHLSSNIMTLLLVINFFVGLFSVFGKSILQGMTNFFGFAVSNITEAVAKVGISVLFVYLGYKTAGAFGAIAISAIASYLAAYIFIRRTKFQQKTHMNPKKLYAYAIPVFISVLSLTSLFTTDIILVRHFFPGNESGYYAVLSIMGKVIYFAVSPITAAMFPIISVHHAKGEKYTNYLLISIIMTFLGSLAVIFFYYWQAEFMIRILPGSAYLKVAPLLGYFGIFIGLYSLCSLLANFYLSIHKITPIYFVGFTAVMQIIAISLFHTSIAQIITISIALCFLLLFTLLLYYPYARVGHGLEKKHDIDSLHT